MKITIKTGNIFDSSCHALVNPVNCVGVMGAGLAKQFKTKFPNNFNKYLLQCWDKTLIIGVCFTTTEANKRIVNFPTKFHWKNGSQYDYIQAGLNALVRHIKHYKITSIAIPELGCGLGGLEFSKIKIMIEETLSILDDEIYVELYSI